MASIGSIKVDLIANVKNFNAGLSTASSNLKNFGNKTANFIRDNKLLIAGALTAVSAAAVKTIKAYGEQEQAIAQLNQSLKNQGNFTEEASKDLQDYAASLQKVTTFGDETILKAQALIASFGFEGQALKDLTKATADLAAAKGFDLVQAADLVSKSVGSSTNALTRYGIEVKGVAGSTDRASSAVENITKLFGGQAETIRETTLGSIQGLSNAFGDLQETLGSLIAGEGSSLVGMLESWVIHLDNSVKLIRDQAKEWGNFGNVIKVTALEALRSIAKGLIDLFLNITKFKTVFKVLHIDIDGLTSAIDRQVDSWQADIQASIEAGQSIQNTAKNTGNTVKKESDSAANKVISDTNKITNFDASAVNKRIQNAIAENQQRIFLVNQRIQNAITKEQERLAFEQKVYDFLNLKQLEWATVAQNLSEQVFNKFGSGVADMILEGKHFSDIMKNIWKDLARQIISLITQMIAKWIVFNALTGGGGLFGRLFQHGGIIEEPTLMVGLKSGTRGLAGEAGPEVIQPVGGQRESGLRPFGPGGTGGLSPAPAMAGASGEASIHINVNGHFIEGSPAKWQDLVRRVIVPEIRRYAMINPVGPFTRRRGAA